MACFFSASSEIEPLALTCLEKSSLLSRLDLSSAPCLAPSFPGRENTIGCNDYRVW